MRAVIDDILSIFRTDPWTEARRSLASKNGWKFSQRRVYSGDSEELLYFSTFKGKGAKRLLSVMESKMENGGRIRVYDLIRYRDFSSKQVTVFEFSHPGLTFTPFTIQPKKPLGKLKDIFVVSDLMIPTTPDFNARYTVTTNHPKELKQDINIEFMDLIGDEAGWKYEGQGRYLVACQPGKVLPPDVLKAQIKRFVQMCETLCP